MCLILVCLKPDELLVHFQIVTFEENCPILVSDSAIRHFPWKIEAILVTAAPIYNQDQNSGSRIFLFKSFITNT